MEFKGYKISLNLLAKKCVDKASESGGGNKNNRSDKNRPVIVGGVRVPPLAPYEINYEEYDPY